MSIHAVGTTADKPARSKTRHGRRGAALRTQSAAAWVVAAICLGLLGVGFVTTELSCDQRPILRIVASLLAGVVASLVFTGGNWVQFGGAGRRWSVRATAGSAAFVMVYLLPISFSNAPCAAASKETLLSIDVSGRIEVAGNPAGVVAVRFPGLKLPVLTEADGSFAVKGVRVGAIMHLAVGYGRQTIAFDVQRPYGMHELHLLLDLASGTSRLIHV